MTVKDFLENDQFIFFMLSKDAESKKYWKSYLSEHPDDKQNFESAMEAFRKIKFKTEYLPMQERKILYDRIFNSSAKPFIRKRRKFRKYYVTAACILVFLSLGIYTTHKQTKATEIVVAKSKEETIQLIAGHKTFTIANNEVLTVSSEGVLNSKGETLKVSDTATYNILKVPFGKRSELVLSDGSKLWINSGSTVKFPSIFTSTVRTIYLDGEIYIEVSKNNLKPFNVRTAKFNVDVYGTTFNVKAYTDATDQRVVLVEGSVGVSTRGNMKAHLMPDESLEITTSQLVKSKVDTEVYTSWKNGYLIFSDTPIEKVLLELSRYYNVSFLDTDQELIGKTCTGKIYLSANLNDVLETLSILSNSSYKIN